MPVGDNLAKNTASPRTPQQMGMKNLLLKNMLLTFEFHNTVSGATDREFVPVEVGLDYHRESIRRAIALLNPGNWVPRSRSFDVAVRWRIRLHGLARPRRSSVTVAPQFEQGDGPGRFGCA